LIKATLSGHIILGLF